MISVDGLEMSRISATQREVAVSRYSHLAALGPVPKGKTLELIVNSQHSSRGNTAENVCSCAVEERLDAVGRNNLARRIQSSFVLDGLTRSHHHAAANGVERICERTGA